MRQTEVENIVAKQITIKGLVQGVGFRPFIYRLAHSYGLHGCTYNTNEAVLVLVQGKETLIELFVKDIELNKPEASKILEISLSDARIQEHDSFQINHSKDVSDEVTMVSPDIAVCSDCLNDMDFQPNRIDYPLINCTHCGPRFSIISQLPYDRPHTTMAPFVMCEECAKEYNQPLDRRFHAQPVACNLCGPQYTLHVANQGEILRSNNIKEIVKHLAEGLENDKIYAFKGVGGFHMACNALSENAVKRLRSIKHRDTKPFAVMFRNLEILKKYCHCSDVEAHELLSFRRPILIMKDKVNALAPSVSLGLGTTGSMLPYMPFHYLLFKALNLDALVMTSGNISDEPVMIDNLKAISDFSAITDGVLTYNRDIQNRVDDSVVSVINEKPRIIRRSRGYVPSPVKLNILVEGILAVGAELTGTFAIGKNDQAILSQYLGDLQHFENYCFYEETYQHFTRLFRFNLQRIVADLHPDYVSTRFAKELKVPTMQVQHHYAHVASVMAEHGLKNKVIGIAFDGTGYGPDGNIWGSEFMIADCQTFERVAHFKYIPLPGGDKSVLEPWRTAVSYLRVIYGDDFLNLDIPFVKALDKVKTNLLLSAMDKGINVPLSCSAGRLFDAVSALTGICANPTFHAEAPMRLEAAVDEAIEEAYSYEFSGDEINLFPMIRQIVKDIQDLKNNSEIAAKFHNTLVKLIVEKCIEIRGQKGISDVALSGGTFQNKYLLGNVENKLTGEGFHVYSNVQVPANDAGIALGQMYIAANRLIS